jgi:hypothetical protein
MKCECGTEMAKCKNGITVGSLNKGIKLSLYKCPKCGKLQRKKEKVNF